MVGNHVHPPLSLPVIIEITDICSHFDCSAMNGDILVSFALNGYICLFS